MKTRSEQLKVLPPGVLAKLKQAVEEQGTIVIMEVRCSKFAALLGLIDFTNTSQGHSYWWAIHTQYFKD